MFDVGFWELVLCAVVALIVLGPERMPVVVRSVAHWLGAARSMLNAVKAEFEQELALDKLKQELMPQSPAAETPPTEQTPPAVEPSATQAAADIQSAIEQLKASSPQRASADTDADEHRVPGKHADIPSDTAEKS